MYSKQIIMGSETNILFFLIFLHSATSTPNKKDRRLHVQRKFLFVKALQIKIEETPLNIPEYFLNTTKHIMTVKSNIQHPQKLLKQNIFFLVEKELQGEKTLK